MYLLGKLQSVFIIIHSKILEDVFFTIPYISTEQVSLLINELNSTKATDLDGIGSIFMKLASNVLALSISSHINKSIRTATLPDQLKWLKSIQYIQAVQALTQQITDQSLFFQSKTYTY